MPSKRSSKTKPQKADLSVQFGRGVRIAPLTTARLRQLVHATLRAGKHDNTDYAITIRFATEREAQSLNRQYRRRRYTPDVLTFPYSEHRAADIVICTPVARRHAHEQHKSFGDHLAHLLVHGCLHAQGYTHDGTDDAARMEKTEATILATFGIADPYVAGG